MTRYHLHGITSRGSDLAQFRNCSGHLIPFYLVSWNGARIRIDTKTIRMLGNVQVVIIHARIGQLGARIDLSSYPNSPIGLLALSFSERRKATGDHLYMHR